MQSTWPHYNNVMPACILLQADRHTMQRCHLPVIKKTATSPHASVLSLRIVVRYVYITAGLACMHHQSLKAAVSHHATITINQTPGYLGIKPWLGTMHASAASGCRQCCLHSSSCMHWSRACRLACAHAGIEAEPRRPDREFDGTVKHQPSHSASAAGGAIASAQKPQPAPAGPGGAQPAAHAAELSGWLGWVHFCLNYSTGLHWMFCVLASTGCSVFQ